VEINVPHAPDMLLFGLSTESLNSLVARLRSLGGFGRYPDVYHALVLERSRRELRSPPQEIRLTREAFEALPQVIRRLLVGSHDRPAGEPAPGWRWKPRWPAS
jgi:hypothetical protein